MHKIVLVLRAMLALLVIAALLGFGFFVFTALLGLAALTSIALWLRGGSSKQGHPPQNASHGLHTLEEDVASSYRASATETITIIDGEAEDVTVSRKE
jgi:hypothetical protein